MFDAFVNIDSNLLDKANISVSNQQPATPLDGELWYDTTAQMLKVYDETAAEWKLSCPYNVDAEIAELEQDLAYEVTARTNAQNYLQLEIQSIQQGNITDLQTLTTRVGDLETYNTNNPLPDFTTFASDTELQTQVTSLTSQINTVSGNIPDITPLALNSTVTALQALVDTLPTLADVQNCVDNCAPDLSSYVTQQDIDTSIGNITTSYLPRTGGTLTGAFVVEKQDAANPAFDFSQEKWYSYNTHKYRTNSTDANYSTFGTNTNPWEYAWDFGANEDFCWVNGDGDKVFPITKDGPAASSLILGDFQPNDVTNGRVMINQVDVRQKLADHDTTLATHTQQLADIITGTYTNDSGVIYSDTAPTGAIDDGALWFDSHNIRLNVRHQGAWIYPDRVEDTALKTALFAAVTQSADFETLKIKLLAALI